MEHCSDEGTAHCLTCTHSIDADLTLRGGAQAKDDVEECTLACTVDAEDCDNFARHQGEVDTSQCLDGAERLMDVRRLQGGCCFCVHGPQSALVLKRSEVSFDAGVPMTNVMGLLCGYRMLGVLMSKGRVGDP